MAGHGTAPTDWDVAVIGAGIIGCAVARELARRGARTVVLEARDVGAGATQASAGVLAPFIEAPAEGPLQEMTIESLAMYDQFVANVEEESNTPIEYRRCGTLEVASDAVAAAHLRSLGEWVTSRGVEAQWLESSDVNRFEPRLAPACGGLLVPSHGYVRASQLTRALVVAARHHGADVRVGHRVSGISCTGDRATVSVGEKTHSAGIVVIAAGSWSAEISSEASVTPVRGQLLRVGWQGPPIERILWSEHCYLVPWLDGTLLVGATVENAGFDERITAGGVRELLNAATAVLPAIADATFVEAKVGLRPGTATGLPIISRSIEHPVLVHATGHFRNGILLAPLTARLVADIVL